MGLIISYSWNLQFVARSFVWLVRHWVCRRFICQYFLFWHYIQLSVGGMGSSHWSVLCVLEKVCGFVALVSLLKLQIVIVVRITCRESLWSNSRPAFTQWITCRESSLQSQQVSIYKHFSLFLLCEKISRCLNNATEDINLFCHSCLQWRICVG